MWYDLTVNWYCFIATLIVTILWRRFQPLYTIEKGKIEKGKTGLSLQHHV